ncbi:MAG TPA: peptidyl-prolyl cis-trans isomerase [Blastocatellia bacterium]|nr:peptidyl-prolyl cis-trans isomerase [Blastocatellia bacterium]
MLKFLSRRKRSRNVILIVFIFAMAITLVAFFTASRSGTAASGSDNGSAIASVDGIAVPLSDFKKRLTYLFPNDPNLQSPETISTLRLRGLDKTIRDVLVKERVVELEARRLNLQATDQEVSDRIAQMFTDGNGKFIGVQEYKNRVAQRGASWVDFEHDLRSNIAREKLNNYITAGVTVSPQEVNDEYQKTETSVSLIYAVIKPSDVRDDIKLSDDELRAYFSAHKDDFKINVDQKKINYLFISTEELSKSIQVDDAELKKRYDTTDQIDQAHIQQIVLNVLTPSDDETVRTKAEGLVARAKGQGSVAGEDFASLAKGQSQDTTTAAKGGDIGWIKRDRNKPSDVYQRAFSMKPGDVSDPIKQNNKYYIIKVLELKKRTFEEAKEGLLVSARNDLSYKKAVAVTDEARAMLLQNHDLDKTAEEINKKYGANVAKVKSTPFFAAGDNIPDIGANQNFEDAVKDLKKPGDIGPKTGIPNGFAVPVFAEQRPPHPAEFEDVKTKVELAAKNEKAKEVAGQKAQQLVQSASSPDALKAAIEGAKLKSQTMDNFKAGSTLTGVGQSGKVEAAALALKQGEVDKQPVKTGDEYVVLAVTKRTDADMAKLVGQTRKTIEDRLLQERKSAIFDAYIDKRYQDLQKAGKIKIYDDVLNSFFEFGGQQ